MSDSPSNSHFLIYEAEDGAIRIDVRFENETVWLTQQLMADLFQTTQQNVSLHLKNIYEEGELEVQATHKDFLSVRHEGAREVQRKLDFYNLDAIPVFLPAPTGRSITCPGFCAKKASSAPTGRSIPSPGHRPGFPCKLKPKALKGRPKQAMPQSLARIHIHLIFSTKNRECVIKDEIRDSLHAYMTTVLQNIGCPPVLINSVEDHAHILFELARTVSVSSAVEEVKKASSKWIKTQGPSFARFSWQAGYGAFAVSESNVPAVREYVANQREHHRRNHFRRNTGFFWSDTKSPSMNDMFGIDSVGWSAPSYQRQRPRLKRICPVGAQERGASKALPPSLGIAPTGRPHASPGRCPRLKWICPVGAQEGGASKAPSQTLCKAPTGRPHASPGQRPGFTTTPLL